MSTNGNTKANPPKSERKELQIPMWVPIFRGRPQWQKGLCRGKGQAMDRILNDPDFGPDRELMADARRAWVSIESAYNHRLR